MYVLRMGLRQTTCITWVTRFVEILGQDTVYAQSAARNPVEHTVPCSVFSAPMSTRPTSPSIHPPQDRGKHELATSPLLAAISLQPALRVALRRRGGHP